MQKTSSGSNLAGLTGAFRLVAYFEAVTYLALLTATVVHRVFDGPDAVSILGPIHGIAFLVYLALVLWLREPQGWGLWQTIVVILASAVPFGGFWAGRHVEDRDEASVTGDTGRPL